MFDLLQLFIMFVKLCAFAFGGGYVMIPSMLKAAEINGWATPQELTDVVAIAGMSPGPVAVNAAVGFGYKVAGFPGAVASFLGIVVPCTIIVSLVATLFFKFYTKKQVQSALYGLRPVIVGIILYAAVSLAMKNSIIYTASQKLFSGGIFVSLLGINLFELKSLILIAITLVLLLKTHIKPLYMILGSGILGMLVF